MKTWKYIVIALLATVAIFHLGVLAFIWNKRYQLTSKDYYDREMAYQEMIDKLDRGNQFQWKVTHSPPGHLVVSIKSKSGNPVVFENLVGFMYRPNQADLDRAIKLVPTENGVYMASVEGFPKGRWDITLQGAVNNTTVAHKQRIQLP